MASSTLTPPRPVKAPPTAEQIIEQAAADITDWCQANRSRCRLFADDTPGTPGDLSNWQDVEEQMHVAIRDAVFNVLDQAGGPVPAGMGERDLGGRS